MTSALYRSALVLLLLLGIAACGETSPEATVRQFYSLLDQGQVSEAYKLLDVPAGMESKANMALSIAADTVHQQGGIASLDVKKVDVNGELAVVEFSLGYKGKGDATNAPVQKKQSLRKLAGEWKLSLK